MNILKRQLALLLVLAMTLTMLPMPAHADEVTEPESLSAIVEESTEKTMVSKEVVTSDTANKPVEKAESHTAAPAVETPVDTAVDSNTTTTEKLIADVSEDTPASDPMEEPEVVIDTDDTTEDAEVEENPESGSTVESEEDSSAADNNESEIPEASEADTQEETDQMESETEVPVFAAFSFRRSAANAVAAECEHLETEVAWDTKDQIINCKPISDAQHQISGYQYRYCTSCYERVGESFAATEMGNHELDTNGRCGMCGYSSNCAHTNTEDAWDMEKPITHEQYSEKYHNTYFFYYSRCSTCHARLSESFSHNELLAHSLDENNTCTDCGYVAPVIEDLQISITTSSGIAHIGDTIQATASVSGGSGNYHFYWEVLKNGGVKVSQTTPYHGNSLSYTIGSEGNFVFVATVIDNKYDEMRATAQSSPILIDADVCSHQYIESALDDAYPVTYTKIDYILHQITRYEKDYCTSCMETVKDSYPVEIREPHTPGADGKCILCEKEPVCTHENVITGYAPLHDPPRYEQYNDTQHFVYHMFKTTCRDCGETLSDGEEAASLEAHVLDNGKCTYCGYGMGENYCTHPATDVMWSNAPMTYTSLNEEQHEVEGCQYHYCTSCYKRICADFPVKEWEDHTFDSTGDCTLCNYRVGCEHKQTTMKLYDTLYESLNKDSHEVTRLYSKVCADPDCGKVLVSVETSYTETDIEDHDFTGNTCLLCNYTVADQLSATVTASGLTANKGDNISATVSVVGGTGGYRFSWKILKDGSVVVENPITTSASCGTNASEEGSYVFQVTVTDSAGNTVTAQSSAITVSHACQYETVTSTKLVNQSLTHHTVETTTYEECIICHEKRNEVTDVEWVEHTPMNKDAYGYEASHDKYHQKYFICECGAHPYIDGEYKTANGKVQEKSVCCICNGHKYGEAQETADGTWKKTCANCGLSQKVAAPVQPTEPEEEEEKHVHSYHDIEYIDGTAHPHRYVLKCSCGHEETGEGSYMLCCQCVGHSMGDAIRLSDGTYKESCTRCNLTQTTTPSGKVQNYYDVIDIIINRKDTAAALKEMETGNFALWKEVAVEAADELTGWGFVLTNELVHNFSENASVVGAAKAFNEQYLNPETWDDQIESLWIDLLIQLLQNQEHNQEDDYIEGGLKGAEMVHFNASAVFKVYSNSIMEEGKEFRALKARLAELTDDIDIINESIDKYTEAAETAGDQAFHFKNTCEMLEARKAEFQTEVDDLADKTKYDSDSSKDFQMLGYFMDITGILLSATSDTAAYDSYAKTMQDLQASANNITILEQVVETAKVNGNKNLENAAYQLIGNIQSQTMSKLGSVIDLAEAFTKSAATSTLEWFINQSAQGWAEADGGGLSILDTIALVAQGVNAVLGWGPVYDEAQILMTLNKMDGNMNIINTLKNDDAPYMLELWGLLQAKGCDSAQDFLDKWKAANFLDCEELGIEKNGIPAVNKALEEDRDYYIEELNLPLEKSK